MNQLLIKRDETRRSKKHTDEDPVPWHCSQHKQQFLVEKQQVYILRNDRQECLFEDQSNSINNLLLSEHQLKEMREYSVNTRLETKHKQDMNRQEKLTCSSFNDLDTLVIFSWTSNRSVNPPVHIEFFTSWLRWHTRITPNVTLDEGWVDEKMNKTGKKTERWEGTQS